MQESGQAAVGAQDQVVDLAALRGEAFPTLAELSAELNVSVSPAYVWFRGGDLKAIQVGGGKQWWVERVMVEDYIAQAYRRTRDNLDQLPSEPPGDTQQ